MRFTLKLVVLFSLIIYLTTGVALYNKALLEVMYWPFYQDNFVLGFMLIGLACFIVLSSFLDEELLQKWFGFDKLEVTSYDSLINILSDMTDYDTIRVCYTKKDLKDIQYHLCLEKVIRWDQQPSLLWHLDSNVLDVRYIQSLVLMLLI